MTKKIKQKYHEFQRIGSPGYFSCNKAIFNQSLLKVRKDVEIFRLILNI